MQLSRDEKQLECVERWKLNKGVGTVVAATGFGKTRIATIIINRFLAKKPDARILVVVPSTYLADQWNNFKLGVKVEVINTAIKNKYVVDLLILDECHRFAAKEFSSIFNQVKYKFILGLTATFQRPDGLHTKIEKIMPVVAEVPLSLCKENNWVSDFNEYDVLINVDLKEYDKINRNYHKFFSSFNHDFDLAMSMLGPDGKQNLIDYCVINSLDYKQMSVAAINFIKYMNKRKTWIHTHPSKLATTLELIKLFKGKKIITFSQYNEQADYLAEYCGVAYHTGLSANQQKVNLAKFISGEELICHTSSKMNEGSDVPGLEVGIMCSGDSSSLKYIQRLGRVIRKEGDKHALFFNLLLAGTQDIAWNKLRKKNGVLTIERDELQHLFGSRTDNNVQQVLGF